MASLDARVFWLSANAELQRIMAAYSNYLSGGQFTKIVQMFSNEQDDVRAEMLWGIYDGYESIQRLYCGLYRQVLCGGKEEKLLPGVLAVHGVNTPLIAVARDGATAKGLWVSPGLCTLRSPEGRNGLQSYWSWQRIGCDFIYENERWKIWHLHHFTLFTTPYEQSWTEEVPLPVMQGLPKALGPDRPTNREAIPQPPMPYDTFCAEEAY
jgi:hypothetical protein